MKKSLCLIALITIFPFLYAHPGLALESKTSADQSKKEAQRILKETWRHYTTHKGFTGDWWTEKFSHPKMIDDNGTPWAFMDSLDIDHDKISDIKWSDPTIPFELIVVSESASYALLRAVWLEDRATFDKVWRWTHDNLQRKNIQEVYHWYDIASPQNGWKTLAELGLKGDDLFAWRWVPTLPDDADHHGQGGVLYYRWRPASKSYDPNNPWRDCWDVATDADQDIALALIFADSLWGSATGGGIADYAQHARDILKDLWDKCTFVVAGMRYLAGGDNMKSIEPGYLSPFSYRIFNDFDPDHDWQQLVDSSYRIFNEVGVVAFKAWVDKSGQVHSNDPAGQTPPPNLLPDWIDLNENGGIVDSQIRREAEFGTDAFRALWRIAVDYAWFKSPEAWNYLKEHSPSGPHDFFVHQINNKISVYPGTDYKLTGKLSSTFWHDGTICDFESNYEPDLNDPFRKDKMVGCRAGCGQYGAYLSYFSAADDQAMVDKLLFPLITAEANGFSKKEYTIPKDRLAEETPQHLAKNIPVEKANLKDDKGLPFGKGDGWYIEDQDGGYWTIYDQSDWNAQMDYFSNTWAWFGLGLYAGVVRNLYHPTQAQPQPVYSLQFISDPVSHKTITNTLSQENFYLLIKGADRDTHSRNWTRVKLTADDPATNLAAISVKLAETAKDSGIFISPCIVKLATSAPENTIGAARDYQVKVSSEVNPNVSQTVKVGQISLDFLIEDFRDANVQNNMPVAWWTDTLNAFGQPPYYPGQDLGYFIWWEKKTAATDKNALDTVWHLRWSTDGAHHSFRGEVAAAGGEIKELKKIKAQPADTIKAANNSVIKFSTNRSAGEGGFDFISRADYVSFDLKMDDLYQGESVYIGQDKEKAFSLPVLLYSQGPTGSYQLSLEKKITKMSPYALKVQKKFALKDYPYFGCFGLSGVLSDWADLDELLVWFYLPSDSGTIRVEAEDKNRVMAIVNEYNPYDPAKGPGWYLWSSNYAQGYAAKEKLCDPVALRRRKFWKKWDLAASRGFISVTSLYDPHDIRNIQFCLDGGGNRDLEIYIGGLFLRKENTR